MSKADTSIVKEGDVFALIRYCTVTSTTAHGGSKFAVKTDDGNAWDVSKSIVASSCYTANQFVVEERKTRGEIAHLFEHAGDAAFTVCFRKQPKAEDIAELLAGADEDVRTMTQAKRRKLAKTFLEGEERVLVGHLASDKLDDFGRMSVMDLVVNERRLVDPRSLEWLILKRVKYVLK